MTHFIAAFVLACFANAAAPEVDSDGDGLSDFHELHKYSTNPASADSDGDGLPDGDWDERREYAYTVRAVVQVLPPVTPDVLCDDYQDARILDRTEAYVEAEFILYPLNTVAEALTGDPHWRETAARMPEWVRPGLTANWDDAMRAAIIAKLEAQGIKVDQLDDRTLVERAVKLVLEHARYVDGFTTFCSRFVDGKVEVYPGLEESARRGQADSGLTLEEQWQRELFARGMFEHAVRGSCTSSAIYLNGCMRALGVPTRIVLAIPLIDATDQRERELLRRLRHHRVRYAVERGTAGLEQGWSSHTFNEVFVGGRWRRLNYERLGQNILDPNAFGLMIHIATFSDWADGQMASTWGVRQNASDHSSDAFGGPNPYSTIALSDRFGTHANVENLPAAEDYAQLTIDRAYWYAEHPADIHMRLDDPDTAGHVIVRVEEGRPGEGAAQYKSFYSRVPKEFLLRAEGQPDVPLRATRGYWAAPEKGLRHFYLRIEPADFERMVADVPYTLVVQPGDQPYRWAVRPGVTLTRTAGEPPTAAPPEAAATPPETADAAKRPESAPAAVPQELTIDRIYWSDASDCPTGQLPGGERPVLLARVGKAEEFDAIKLFTEHADRRFFLEAKGYPTLKVGASIGGVTTREHSYAVIMLGPGDWRDLVEGVEYRLRAQNSSDPYRWKLAGDLRAKR